MKNYFKSYLINSFFLIVSIIFIAYGFFNLDFLKGNNIDEYTNNYCQTNYSSLICKNKYKKNKFIWIFVDGNAYDQLVLLSNKTKYKIPVIFRGKGKGYKHTSPLFSEMFTGVPSRDLKYNKLNMDHIFIQLSQAKYIMNFLGINAPVNSLCGKDNKIFKNKRILGGHEKCSFCNFCNVTYNIEDSWCKNYYKSITNRDERLLDEISKEKVYEGLDHHFKIDTEDIIESINLNECFKKSFFEFTEKESIIYYNTEIDKYNHLLSKGHIKTISEEYNTENWIIKIMHWIDEHPDYVLIVNSDHGGQKFYGEDMINNHGLDIEGNEAILFIYTKDFKDNYEKLKMENIFYSKSDPASIISQILENVNIPLQSRGIAYPIVNDSLFRYTAYKSKEIQLLNQLNTYIQKYPSYESELNKIIDKIKNSEFYQIKEEEYEIYFNEIFGKKSINFIKDIQDEIIYILNDKNKNIFSHIFLFLVIVIISSCIIFFNMKDLFSIIKDEEANIYNLFLLILFISLAFIQILNFISINLSIHDRLVIGIFATPFCLIFSNILIKYKYEQHYDRSLNIFFILIGIISIILHYIKFFIFIKELFSAIIYSRLFNALCLYPILFFELNYNIRKNFLNTNIYVFKYPLYNIMKIIYISYIILIFCFDMFTDNYFESHTPFNYFITIFIYILFIIIFILAEIMIKFNIENNIEGKNQELIKILFFLFEFFINDESNRLMLLIIYILFEYAFDMISNNEKKIIKKILIAIMILNINEIFYLIVSRVYSVEESKLVLSRTIFYSTNSGGNFKTFLKVIHKIRFSVITVGYLLDLNLFKNKKDNDETFIIKLILNIRCSLNFIFFVYEFIFLKNNEDYMTLMMYSFVDLCVFLLDFINQILIYLNIKIINYFIKSKYASENNLLGIY